MQWPSSNKRRFSNSWPWQVWVGQKKNCSHQSGNVAWYMYIRSLQCFWVGIKILVSFCSPQLVAIYVHPEKRKRNLVFNGISMYFIYSVKLSKPKKRCLISRAFWAANCCPEYAPFSMIWRVGHGVKPAMLKSLNSAIVRWYNIKAMPSFHH